MIAQSAQRELQIHNDAESVRNAICAAATSACVDAFGNRLRGIVLSGSLARNEATFAWNSERCDTLGDAEFFLVFQEGRPLPGPAGIQAVRQQVERALIGEGIGCHIELSPVHPKYLSGLQPHILAYELKACGQVVWGDPGLLSLIPRFSASDIFLEDAWRLLCNRMVEYLITVPDLSDAGSLSPAAFYRTVKLYLDTATSFLLFVGSYEPTYRARAERLRSVARTLPANITPPFPLPEFAERIDFCTRFKLGDCDVSDSEFQGADFWKDAVEYAHRLWSWELTQLTCSETGLGDHELMRRWTRQQELTRRLRGWVRVFRDSGWRGGYKQWPRWALLACTASPRHWVYAAGADIFFRLPALAGVADAQQNDTFDPAFACRGIPFRPSQPETEPAWRRAAAAVLSTYHRFVSVTRA